jgi:hypothetical protein
MKETTRINAKSDYFKVHHSYAFKDGQRQLVIQRSMP